MDLELAEIAAGLPMAASLALAGGITTLREGRRRSALNEAVHELRRPLQAMSLSLTADSPRAAALDSSLLMAAVALDRLDREINGQPAEVDWRPVDLELVLGSAVGRWQTRAVSRGGSLRLWFEASEPSVVGDEVQIAQAVDNLISNAIEHGGPEVRVEVREAAGKLQIAVLDAGASSAGTWRRSRADLRDWIGGRRRHGHGLRIVERVARAHGGSFRLRRLPRGAEACIELPARDHAGPE